MLFEVLMRANKGVLIASLLGLALGAAQPAMSAGTSPSTVTLASSANPAIFGEALKLTATVAPSGATGEVAFYDGANLLDSVPLAAGQATITTITLPHGNHVLHARYEGDATYASATSANLSQTVMARPGNGFMAPITMEGEADYVAIGDFDGDGNADLAILGPTSVSVALGNGDGTFKAPVSYPFGGSVQGPGYGFMVVGDFNGDGKPDLVVTGTNVISVLLGNGDGTFQAPIETSLDFTPYALTVGDFNGDGIADLAVEYEVFVLNATAYEGVLLGNGDGTFKPFVGLSYGPTVPGPPVSMASLDWNGDGIPDLAVSWPTVEQMAIMSIFFGNGDGTFRVGVTPDSAGGVIVVDDFNGDGRPDIACVGNTQELGSLGVYYPQVLLDNGPVLFAGSPMLNGGTLSIASGDFNGDGIADLVAFSTYDTADVDNGTTSSYGVLFGKGDGTFHAAVEYPLPYANYNELWQSTNIVTGDFNHDGVTDFAVATGSTGVQIVLGKPALPFSLSSSLNPASLSQNITLTAQVSPAPASTKIVFYDHDTVLGTVALTEGSASLNISTLLPGRHDLAAAYTDGNGTHISPLLVQNVLFPTETITLTSSLNPAAQGQAVTLTTTMSPAWPGTVYFYDQNTLLGAVAFSGGTASLGTAALAPGVHRIGAVYEIDGALIYAPLLIETITAP
jgi:hypothetical protein